MRRKPPSRSTLCCASAATRSQIAPTVRHAIRSSCATADFDVLTANHAVPTVAHTRRVGLHERQRRPEIQRAPAPTTVAKIKPRTAEPADTAAISLPPTRSGGHDDLSLNANPHVLDDRPRQAQQPRPYPCAAHVASAPLDSSREETGTLGEARRAPSITRSHHPREQQKRRKTPKVQPFSRSLVSNQAIPSIPRLMTSSCTRQGTPSGNQQVGWDHRHSIPRHRSLGSQRHPCCCVW